MKNKYAFFTALLSLVLIAEQLTSTMDVNAYLLPSLPLCSIFLFPFMLVNLHKLSDIYPPFSKGYPFYFALNPIFLDKMYRLK